MLRYNPVDEDAAACSSSAHMYVKESASANIETWERPNAPRRVKTSVRSIRKGTTLRVFRSSDQSWCSDHEAIYFWISVLFAAFFTSVLFERTDGNFNFARGE